MFDIKYNISILPESPGVYLMKDEKLEIIYVGKAKNLKKRVSQYFQSYRNHSEKTRSLVSHIKEFEFIATENEIEALILENNLIKKYNPRYNILLKDDKTYPFIKITVNEDFPRIFLTRNYIKDGNLYFGPFTLSSAASEIVELIKNIFPIRNCKIYIKEGSIACRPCMYYQIKKCNAPCFCLVSKKEYLNIINQVIKILSGENKDEFISSLECEMMNYADNYEYEKAIDIRDKINNIKIIFEKQRIFLGDNGAEDFINIFRYEKEACVQVFFLRDGKIIGRDHFIVENVKDEENEKIIERFIKGFYGGTAQIPKTIYSPEFSDRENIINWINETNGKKVEFKTPKKGDKKEIFDLVGKNARMTLDRFKVNEDSKNKQKDRSYLKDLASVLSISLELERIEAYDISNISGLDSVGSMVVFKDGVPQNTQYRRFKVKTVKGANDYDSMREIIYRRFNRGLKEVEELKEGKLEFTKGKFCIFPDLILVDGGRGHVNVVSEVLKHMKINIPVCGMVKDDKHRTRGLIYKNEEIYLSKDSSVMKFITRVQDEVHRYAITYHRTLRDKRGLGSILNEIPNIGEKRRRDLLIHFKDVESIKKASLEDLLKVSSMDKRASLSLIEFFKKNNNK